MIVLFSGIPFYRILQVILLCSMHMLLVRVSRRPFNGWDLAAVGGLVGLLASMWIFYFVSIVCGAYASDWFGPAASAVVVRTVFIGVPGLVAGVLLAMAWKSWLPLFAAALTVTMAAVTVDHHESVWWQTLVPLGWHAAYFAACVPLIRARRGRCLKQGCHICGYPREGISDNARCPECGLKPDS